MPWVNGGRVSELPEEIKLGVDYLVIEKERVLPLLQYVYSYLIRKNSNVNLFDVSIGLTEVLVEIMGKDSFEKWDEENAPIVPVIFETKLKE